MPQLIYKNLTVAHASTAVAGVPYSSLKQKILGARYQLSIVFSTPKTMRALNVHYRKKTYLPDVLSFPYDTRTGEIYLSLSTIRAKAREAGVPYQSHVLRLLIHSMLHLKGYRHSSRMEREEARFTKLFRDARATFPHEQSRHRYRNTKHTRRRVSA